MSTVAQIFGHRSSRLGAAHPKLAFNSHVGIELEIEEVGDLNIPYWNCVEDGSLRNGCELVCAEPYAGETLFNAIEALSEAVGNSEAQGTWRCSTHVHLDVRDCDSNVVKKIILAYAFYERMLFKCSGFHRYRSNFCPAFAVVQAQLMNASSSFNYDGERFFNRLLQQWDKYTSLNLLPLAQFGSVEFRISEPKWKRTNLINLVNRYLVLKKLAVENSNLSDQEFVNFLNTCGFTPMIDYLPLDYAVSQDDLDFGFIMANDVLNIRHSSVVIANRVRLGGPNEEDILDNEYPVEHMLRNWSSYAGHTLSKNVRYRGAFAEVFGTTQRDNVSLATIRQCRSLIRLWTEVLDNHRNDEDPEVRGTIITEWNASLERFIDNI